MEKSQKATVIKVKGNRALNRLAKKGYEKGGSQGADVSLERKEREKGKGVEGLKKSSKKKENNQVPSPKPPAVKRREEPQRGLHGRPSRKPGPRRVKRGGGACNRH